MIFILTGMFRRDSNCATARTCFLDIEELETQNISALLLYTVNLGFILALTVKNVGMYNLHAFKYVCFTT
jgi:hypothetical protein